MARSNPGAYFDQYPGFEPDPQRPLEEEFRRLARFKGWSNKGKKIAQERDAFLLAQFYVHLGAVERSKRLEDWQGLCRELRVDPIPGSIKQCKMVLFASYEQKDSC